MNRTVLRSCIAPALALGALSCVTPPLEAPRVDVHQQTNIRVAQNIKNKVDVLFLVDNSNSMDAMSQELRARFGQFFKVFQELAQKGTNTDLHIGVVTSDYGAGATGAPGCLPSPGVGQGKLLDLGAKADSNCLRPLGKRWIEYDFATGKTNLPQGQDLVKTFTCMASTDTTGCGFEHVLESVYAALHNNIQENAGFIRPDALLTVVFLTNEDDCSAPPTSDLFDKAKTGAYGYEASYRCTRFGIQCGNQLPPDGDSGGALQNCQPAGENSFPGAKLYDVSRYIDYFTKPASQGGVKVNPQDVILVGIMAPADPVQVILSNPGTAGGSPYVICKTYNPSSNPPCVPVLQHSCQNSAQPVFFGDPGVRMASVIKSVKVNKISSICDGDYTGALQDLGRLIVSNIGGGCILSYLPDPNNPDCVVEDVTSNQDGTKSISEIPNCAKAGGTYPCWKIEQKATCGQSPQGIGVTIDRNNMPAPPNTEAQVACYTQANAPT